jgi:hypothetical protein
VHSRGSSPGDSSSKLPVAPSSGKLRTR